MSGFVLSIAVKSQFTRYRACLVALEVVRLSLRAGLLPPAAQGFVQADEILQSSQFHADQPLLRAVQLRCESSTGR
jgi:hypothetical protein